MRAIVHDRYGPPEVLRLDEVPTPVPADDEVLVRVHATTVTRTDVGLRSAELPISRLVTGLVRPRNRILGMEFAGVVEVVGADVTEFKVGDEVFGGKGFGAHAEYVTIRASGPLAHKPAGVSFEEAAAVTDGAMLALPCLRAANVGAGQSVVVYGASGSVGTAGVQLAKHLGAHVTAVTNPRTVELVGSLGADEVIDYTREDFTQNGESYDAIFDAVGKHSFRRSRRSLKAGGTFVETDLGFIWHAPLLVLATRWAGSRKVKIGITRFNQEDVRLLERLIGAGAYRAVIDRTYTLEQVVEASRHVETGQKTGNVVLTVSHAGEA
jgi:NADPH:quinone reductase-like Zn-dependent oxidoreductase